MSEHDIQSELPLRSRPPGEDALGELPDIRRTKLGAFNQAILGLSFLACATGALGSALLLGIVTFYAHREGWEFAVWFGIWDSLPYAFLILPIWSFRRCLSASTVMLIGTLGIAGYGLFTLQDALSEFLHPLPPGVRCCEGPSSVPFDLPHHQCVLIIGTGIVAWVLYWFENGKPILPRGGLPKRD